MTNMDISRLQRCVYCGTVEELTAEHAPPKLVFAEPRPNDLITVPACRKCNEAGSKDAEYFRLCLCLNPISSDLAPVTALKPTVRRSLERPQALGFLQSFINAMTPISRKGAILTVDMGRIHNIIRRTARCLFFHEMGQRIPDDYGVAAMSIESLQRMGPEAAEEFDKTFFEALVQQPVRESAGGQFAYVLYRVEAAFDKTSVCAMVFYRALPFVVFIAPK